MMNHPPIRVLQVISRLTTGGVQSVVLNYAKQMGLYGVVFDYVVESKGLEKLEQQYIAQGSKIYVLPNIKTHPLQFIFHFYRLLRRNPSYQIIHTHHNFLNFLPLGVAKLAGVKMRISHSHSSYRASSWYSQLVRPILRRIICWTATHRWACSVVAYQWLYGRSCAQTDSDRIIYNALDLSQYVFSPKTREKIRREFHSENQWVGACIASLSPIKNHTFLLEVLALEKKRNSNWPLELWLIGEGSQKDTLQQQAKRLGVSNRVKFLGRRLDVAQLLNAADVVLLPSLAEGLPMCLLETQANGMPVIASKMVPPEVAINQNVYFLPISSQDTALWVDTLEMLKSVSRDHLAQEHLRNAGYDITVAGKTLADLYQKGIGL